MALTDVMGGKERLYFVKQACHDRYMGEISPTVNRAWGKFSESPLDAITCDTTRMNDIEEIRETIAKAMEAKGFSKRSLSKAADLSESAVRDLMTRTDNPGIGTLRKIADALEMPVDLITGAVKTLPLLGRIGAGGEVLFAVDPNEELYNTDDLPRVPCPPLASGKLMALEVVGASMLPKYEDGDVVYVRRDHDGVLAAYLGKYCAVRTNDGGTFLKILSPGTEAGRYTLRSLNAPDMENVEVDWAAPVIFTMQKQAM